MKKLLVVWMLVAVTSTTLYVQDAAAYQAIKATPDTGSNASDTHSIGFQEPAEGNRRTYNDAQARLTALRAQLAEGWQSLGMSKNAAEQVAAGYQENGTLTAHRVSVRGKSDAQIAAMLQSALAKKDYMLANQTLISFQRKKLKQEGHASPDG